MESVDPSQGLPRAPSPLGRIGIHLDCLACRGRGRWCPVCGKESRKFRRGGTIPRDEAICIHCGSMERHRWTWLYFEKQTDLFDGCPKQMLHVAPERCFEPRLRKELRDGYITADLSDPKAMIQMDIASIPFPANHFDIIYCSHVLEHVPDDRKAMYEFHRVLKPTGWAILLVPITESRTLEDPSATSPADRLRLFGQEDHVRSYGPDYADRLREAGFNVKITPVADLIAGDDVVRMGLQSNCGEIHFCTRKESARAIPGE